MSSKPAGFLVPAGYIAPYKGDADPKGWLLCDGREVSRARYPGLFAAIQTQYGDGDGSDTFNLPRLLILAEPQSGEAT